MYTREPPTDKNPLTSTSDDFLALLHAVDSGDDAKTEARVLSMDVHREGALDRVLALLESDQPDYRWWAVRALAAFDQPLASSALIRALRDSEPEVRQCAALGLRLRPTPSAIPVLITALDDKDRLLSRLAADALTAIGPVAIAALDQTMQSPIQAARIEATRAMAGIRSPQAIPALFAALNDPSPLVIHWAEQGLEWLGVGMLFFKP